MPLTFTHDAPQLPALQPDIANLIGQSVPAAIWRAAGRTNVAT